MSRPTPITQQYYSIQVLRGIAVLGVIAFHSRTIDEKYFGGGMLLPELFRLGQSGVDLFFVISGFIMVTVTHGRFTRDGEMKRFLWGRLTRIYPTYWFYFCLTAAVFLIKPHWVNASQGNQVDLLSSLLLLPSNQLPLIMVAWSLIFELWFYFLFSVLLLFHERLLAPALLSWGAIIAIINLLVVTDDVSPYLRVAIHPYSLQFVIGALIAVYASCDRPQKFHSRLCALVGILGMAVGLSLVYVFDILNEDGLLRVSLFGALYGFAVFSVVTVEKRGRFPSLPFFYLLGTISYTLYLSHVLVLSAVGRSWQMTGHELNDRLGALTAFIAMLAVVIGYGWIGYTLIEKPMHGFSHRLRAKWFEPHRNAPNSSQSDPR